MESKRDLCEIFWGKPCVCSKVWFGFSLKWFYQSLLAFASSRGRMERERSVFSENGWPGLVE